MMEYVGWWKGESGQNKDVGVQISYRLKGLRVVFAIVYMIGILALFYNHISVLFQLFKSNNSLISIPDIIFWLSFLVSNVVLALLWVTRQVFRFREVKRWTEQYQYLQPQPQPPSPHQSVENKSNLLPALDIFICTADPHKEPPMNVVDTALSVMAYDYPTQNLSIYLSDDGASQYTLFAFILAANFAAHWLPFCKQNNLLHRSPQQFFNSNGQHLVSSNGQSQNIKMMYESMKMKVEQAMERGSNIIIDEDVVMSSWKMEEAFSKWTQEFTPQNHPPVIQVLLQNDRDRDITGQHMPNLIYVCRGKSMASPHHFKAGALNNLLRVSAIMTNAPLILTLDCDMFSNNPKTPLLVLPYLLDPNIASTLAYVQFPQRFRTLDNNDIYASSYKMLCEINASGFDGLSGPNYVGTGCFFNRRAFFGGPYSFVEPEIPELKPDHVVNKPISCESIMALAHYVANSNYDENNTKWGSKTGFMYGSLVEDFFTGYRLQCEGWKSILCNPEKAAFLGDMPIVLVDALNQYKRWMLGVLQIFFSGFNPFIYGTRSMGLLMGLGYAHYTLWAFMWIPLIVYAFLPQLALLNGLNIFPKVSEASWFILYIILFLGAYGEDFVDLEEPVQRWWNDQRMWMIRGISSSLFGSVEFYLKSLGIGPPGFVLTSKVLDHEVSKRYNEGLFEFGVASPMFVPLTTAAIINLAACARFFTFILRGSKQELEELLLQMLLSTFITANCWPIYEGMFLRIDKGRIPTKITIISACLAWALYALSASLIIRTTQE